MDLNRLVELAASFRLRGQGDCRESARNRRKLMQPQERQTNKSKMEQLSQQGKRNNQRTGKRFACSTSRLLLAAVLLLINQTAKEAIADAEGQQQHHVSSNSSGEESQQTFARAISRAATNGKQMRRDGEEGEGEEEANGGGFIMRTVPTIQLGNESNPFEGTTSVPATTRAAQDVAEGTTQPAHGGAEQSATTTQPPFQDNSEDRIAINPSRQRFPTHDQLLNASTKDEQINLAAPGSGQSSRAGMSRLAHASSFLSGKLS